jgi:Putative Actinobacterial Holin-X, holin superfamily III
MTMALTDDLNKIGHLVGDSVEQVAKLLQNEANLAKAELSAKLAEAGRAVGYLAAATIFATPAIVMLLFALAQFLVQQGFSPAAGHLISAVVALAIGGLLAMTGIQKLKAWSPTPSVTVREIQRDVNVAKELVR